MIFRRLVIIALLAAATAGAQQRPIFDPDDFIEPAQLGNRPLFISRLMAGGVLNAVDDYRPLRQDVGLVFLANSFYWRWIQFDYKRIEFRGEDNAPTRVQQCDCPGPIYFPTPPPHDATPLAPLPSSRDMLQFATYVPVGGDKHLPGWWRFRGSWTRQTVDTIVTLGDTESRKSGKEQSFGLDADIFVPLRGWRLYSTLHVSRTERTGTTDDLAQNEFIYAARLPGRVFREQIIVRPSLSVGGVSDRDGTALNVINPAVEAFYRHSPSGVNFHLIWSPVSTNSGAEGWKTTQQVAIYADYALVVTRFR